MGNKDSGSFINEKIVKKRKSLKKVIQNGGFFCVEALAFGVLAAVAFAWIEPKMDLLMNGEEPPVITLPGEQTNSTEAEKTTEGNTENSGGKENDTAEKPSQEEKEPETEFAQEIRLFQVTVTGNIFSDDGNHKKEAVTVDTSGVIIAAGEDRTLILTNYSDLKDSKVISVTFENGIQCAGRIKKYDADLNVAVIDVETGDMLNRQEKLQAASLGNSNRIKVGENLTYSGVSKGAGKIYGTCQVASTDHEVSLGDCVYMLYTTNLAANVAKNGFVYNEKGRLVGMVTNIQQGNIPDLVSVLGISELKPVVEKLSNGQSLPYMGLSGTTVTDELIRQIDSTMPYGVYVNNVKKDSPAYEAGLLRGDIITGISGKSILTRRELSGVINSLRAGNEVGITVQRKGKNGYKEITFSVTIGRKAESNTVNKAK